jgi:hypothetical protein
MATKTVGGSEEFLAISFPPLLVAFHSTPGKTARSRTLVSGSLVGAERSCSARDGGFGFNSTAPAVSLPR